MRIQQIHHLPFLTTFPSAPSYMIESTPARPYGGQIEDMLKVEDNMRLRRQQAASVLPPDEVYLTMTVFPR